MLGLLVASNVYGPGFAEAEVVLEAGMQLWIG
jgi:hypothetical protein